MKKIDIQMIKSLIAVVLTIVGIISLSIACYKDVVLHTTTSPYLVIGVSMVISSFILHKHSYETEHNCPIITDGEIDDMEKQQEVELMYMLHNSRLHM